MNNGKMNIADHLNIIWTIASKDIVDSLRNKLVLTLILGLGTMLLMPQLLGLILDPPYTEIRVYDPGSSSLVQSLHESDQFNVVKSSSAASLKAAIGGMGMGLGAEFGLEVPEAFDQMVKSEGQVTLKGYVAWANRAKTSRVKSDYEKLLPGLIDQPVSVTIDMEVVYPDLEDALLLAITTWTAVIVIFMMGLNLVPHLLFEEKQTKTMDALLVSPASRGQVVAGKALAGSFYILVTAIVVFAINWKGVVHWDLVILFVIAAGVFTVATGLVLGSFFSRQQEVTGLSMFILLVFIGSIFIQLMNLDIPVFVGSILPWVPSVALAEIIQLVFVKDFQWSQIWLNLMRLLVVSVPLYILVVWKISRSDR